MLSISGILVGPPPSIGNVVDSVVMLVPEVDNVVTLTDLSLLKLLEVDCPPSDDGTFTVDNEPS